jgi:uncharacterized protein YraI
MKKYLIRVLIFVTLLVPSGLIDTTTTQAQTGIVWTTQFYNNPDLAGPPVLTRSDGSIGFDWGSGSPAPGTVNSESFSARFATTQFLTSGAYQFTALADDSIRLFVDGILLIDSFGTGQHGQFLSADVTLSAGSHLIRLDYSDLGGEAYVFLDWNRSGLSTSPQTEGPWSAAYFDNQNLTGAPAFTTTEASPTHNWQANAPVHVIPADHWSARWTRIETLTGGTYRITVRADDGVRVYVDGVAYIDEWHEAAGNSYSVDLTLSAGQHIVQVTFYDNQGLAFLEYDLEEVSGPTVLPQGAGQYAEVTIYSLRVRDEPSTITGRELTQVKDGEVYPILGRSPDRIWWQIDANGTIGWVHGAYIDVAFAQDAPPGTSTIDGITAQVTPTNLNMRAGPSLAFNILRVLPRGTVVRVDGRDLAGNWLLITVGGIEGWVSSRLADLEVGTTVFEVPVAF